MLTTPPPCPKCWSPGRHKPERKWRVGYTSDWKDSINSRAKQALDTLLPKEASDRPHEVGPSLRLAWDDARTHRPTLWAWRDRLSYPLASILDTATPGFIYGVSRVPPPCGTNLQTLGRRLFVTLSCAGKCSGGARMTGQVHCDALYLRGNVAVVSDVGKKAKSRIKS